MLIALRDELKTSLGDALDPSRKESVISKIEDIFSDGTRKMTSAVRDLVAGNPDSPLGRLHVDVKTEFRDIRSSLDELTKQVAIERAATQASADVFELTAIKGRAYQELVLDAVADFAALYGDEPTPVWDDLGNHDRVGDIVVRLTDAYGLEHQNAVVVEAKDEKLSLRKALDELDQAIANRGASAGVIVFSSQEKAPIAAPCRPYGPNRFVAVLDKNDGDRYPLRLALMHARCAVHRQHAEPESEVDIAGALTSLEEGHRVLTLYTTIKKSHSAARKNIDYAENHSAEMTTRLETILTDIAAKLRR